MGLTGSRRFSYPAAEAQKGQQFPAGGAQNQRQFPAFRDGWPNGEHVVTLPLDGAQNLPAAAAEQFKIQRHIARYLADQRKSLIEKRTRKIDLATDQAAKLRRDDAFGNLRFADA